MTSSYCLAPKQDMYAIQNQKGVSLIGLMIGLLVSMVAVLGSLSLYTTLTQVSVDTVFDAQHNGNTATSMLRIQMEIQAAGYGLNKPDPAASPTQFPHIVTIPNSTDPMISQEVRWRTQLNPSSTLVQCARIIERPASHAHLANHNTGGGRVGKELVLQKTDSARTANCTATGNLNNITTANWNNPNTSNELLGVSVINRIDAAYSRSVALTHIFDFQLLAKDCSPFGMMPTQALTSLRVSYASAASLNSDSLNATAGNGNTQRLIAYELCIANPVS
ncbi:PilW family protein [Marinagarivorans algicola]|uniref:PilW family protein n=1 Tax=Marinagarivorans algicola TaxID=1513270 RepID=UPI0006B9F112|nr:hypothetical protein [Marinagarivorans algicola]